MEPCGKFGKWCCVLPGVCWRSLWAFLLVGVLMVAACQGNGEVGEDTSELSRGAGEDAGELPEGAGEATTELPRETGEATSESAEDPGATVDRIAFVGATGELFTIRPDGSDRRSLAGAVERVAGTAGSVLAQARDVTNYYTWPTWSPGGSKIAASKVQASDGEIDLSLVIIDVETARARTVYTNELVAQIAPGAPHYLYWSPDDRHLAFLATAPGGLTLFILDSLGENETAAPAVVPPIYYQWAADGDSLIVHHREDVNLVRKPFLDRPQGLVTTSGNYRAPALSPEGRQFAYIDTAAGGSSLVVAPVGNPEEGSSILDVGRRAAFIWSPGGGELAVADQMGSENEVFERIRIVSSDGQDVRPIGEGPILAFFWSPQGDKIAWVVLDLESRSFDWKVSESDGGEAKQLFRFRPSDDSFTMLSYFDQYAHSHTPWSPDGTRLVVSGMREGAGGGSNGAAPTEDKVFVLDASGDQPPRSIASGTLAVWSWN